MLDSVRAFAIKVQPYDDESLRSYLERLAIMYDVPIAEIFKRTGMLRGGRSARFLDGYGVLLSDSQITLISQSTRLAPDRVKRMVLSAYGNIVFSWPDVVSNELIDLRTLGLAEWVYLWGSHVCPQCLTEDEGAWRLSWKLPWSFLCVRHKVLLVDTCPSCQARPASGRRDGSLAPLFIDHVPRSNLCGNPKNEVGKIARGKGAQPCGCDLSSLSTVDLSDCSRLLAAQSAINERISSELTQNTERPAARALSFFSELRSVSALSLYCATPDTLGELPEPVSSAFAEHVEERDDIIHKRQKFADGRKGPRQRVYSGAPRSASIMAAILPLAVSIVQQQDMSDASRLVKPLIECMIKRCSTVRWDVLQQFSLSPRLLEAVTSASTKRMKFARIAGLRSTASTTLKNVGYAFEVRHVPQLFDQDVFDADFAALLPQINANNARRFCSMALVKLCGNYTWRDAGTQLMLPTSSYGMANRAIGVLQQNLTYDLFARRLNQYAQKLAAAENRRDYGMMRRKMETFTVIDDEDWSRVCHEAGISILQSVGKRRNSAAWVWSFCTGGDWVLAPAMRTGNQESFREMYRRFMVEHFPDLKPHLLAYAKSFIA